MVEDINNFDDVYDGIDIALDDGMEALHDTTLSRVMRNWYSGTDAMGNSWPQLAAATVDAKGSSQILTDSGGLKANVKAESEYRKKTRTSVITSTLPYAAVHEFGLAEQGIPARPFLGPAAEFAMSKLTLISDELDDQLVNAEIK